MPWYMQSINKNQMNANKQKAEEKQSSKNSCSFDLFWMINVLELTGNHNVCSQVIVGSSGLWTHKE